jgi:hypothetical protein
MTSQIALFNSLGVAIASDTVTTHSGNSSIKTTNNSEKLWLVGKGHLIVVTHSDSVIVNGINVRNLVTEWSRTLTSPLERAEDYPRSFVSWLDSNTHLATRESQIFRANQILYSHYEYIRHRFDFLSNDENWESAPADLFAQLVAEARQYVESLPEFELPIPQSDLDFLKSGDSDLSRILSDLFAQFDFFDNFEDELVQQAPYVLSRIQNVPGEAELGFVGFGSRDFFAKSVRLHLKGIHGDLWRYSLGEAFPDAPSISGSISFFAQYDAIRGFLRGANDFIIDQIVDFAWESVYNAVDGDDDEMKADEAVKDLREKIESLIGKTYASPMLDTIGSLSLTDLAGLAQSLVGIQAMRAAAEKGPATVGGTIETLVISKAHGVQWLSRLPGLPLEPTF